MKNRPGNDNMETDDHSNTESDLDDSSPVTGIANKHVKSTNHPLSNKVRNAGLSSAGIVHGSWISETIVTLHFKIIVVIFAIIALLAASHLSRSYFVSSTYKEKGNVHLISEREDKLLKYLDFLKTNYCHQNQKLWNVIGSQIAEYLNQSTAPLTFVMAYKEADKTAKLLATELSKKAVELKHSDDVCGDLDSLKIEGTSSEIDGGYLLKEKLSSISRCKKLIIFNVENLRPSAAADLHSLLDPDYPNVASAVYIFTVKIMAESDRSIYRTVGNLLKEHWGTELHADKLEPLLSRLVNFVKVEPEPDIDF